MLIVKVHSQRVPEKKKYGTTCNNSQPISLCRIGYCLDHIQVDLIATP